jgi:AcrR family transcriptional regulator
VTAPQPPSRPPRRDARANAERLLAAAVTAMLREGRRVPMATIAEEAGVGVGTLYRHYPDRDALLAALTERSFRLVLALAEDAAERDEPADAALCWFLDGTIAHRSQLVLPLHGGPAVLTAAAQQIQGEVRTAIGRLLDRGQREGVIRADVTPVDIVIFGAMLAQPLPTMTDWDGTARRYAGIFVAGLHPGAGSAPPR